MLDVILFVPFNPDYRISLGKKSLEYLTCFGTPINCQRKIFFFDFLYLRWYRDGYHLFICIQPIVFDERKTLFIFFNRYEMRRLTSELLILLIILIDIPFDHKTISREPFIKRAFKLAVAIFHIGAANRLKFSDI